MSKYILPLLILALIAFYFYQNRMGAKQATVNAEQGEAFLAKNKNRDGVVTTSSGLQYLQLQAGTGTVHPGPTDAVKVHYHGTLITGEIFDSSVDRGEPITFRLDQVIRGWTEGLGYMVEGEKTRLFIPAELAYGNRSAGSIKPGSTLVFDVELIAINPGQ